MSDWKKRATPVDDALAVPEWKQRALANQADRTPFEGIPAEPVEPEADWLEPKSLSGTALRQFNKGAALNFADEIGGAMGAGDELGRRIRTVFGATGPQSTPVENEALSLPRALIARYLRERDASRSEDAAGAAKNPKTALAANIAGGIVSPVPFGKSKALTMAGKGAISGGLAGIGDSRAELLQGDIGDTLIDGATGAAGGAVLGRVFGGAGRKAGVKLGQRAEENALKAVGVKAGISDALGNRGYETLDDARALGRTALDDGLIPWLGTAEDVAKNAAEAQTHRGAMIENALAASKASGVAPDFDAISMRAALNASEGNMLPTAVRAGGKARQIVSDIGKLGETGGDIIDANKMKSQVYDNINWGTETGLSTKLQKNAVRGLREGIEEHVENTAGPQLADELRTANQRYGQLADIKSLAQEEARRQAGRVGGTVSGAIGTAMLGGAVGGPAGGIGAAATKYGLEKAAPYLKGFTARAQNALAPGMAEAGRRVGNAASELTRQTQEALRRPKDQQDEDAVAAWLNGT